MSQWYFAQPAKVRMPAVNSTAVPISHAAGRFGQCDATCSSTSDLSDATPALSLELTSRFAAVPEARMVQSITAVEPRVGGHYGRSAPPMYGRRVPSDARCRGFSTSDRYS
jgi:hypothetical protein